MKDFFDLLYMTGRHSKRFCLGDFEKSYSLYFMRNSNNFERLVFAVGRGLKKGEFKFYNFLYSDCLRDKYVMALLIDFLDTLIWFNLLDPIKPRVKTIG